MIHNKTIFVYKSPIFATNTIPFIKSMKKFLITFALALAAGSLYAQSLQLNSKDYLERQGVNVMVYGNPFSAIFYDEKRSGIDVIHHGVLTITNGGVRLSDTPEQWDLVPEMESRHVDRTTGTVSVKLHYKEYDFNSEIKVAPKDQGFTISVFLDKPVPAVLVGKAGFNLEFLPTSRASRTLRRATPLSVPS